MPRAASAVPRCRFPRLGDRPRASCAGRRSRRAPTACRCARPHGRRPGRTPARPRALRESRLPHPCSDRDSQARSPRPAALVGHGMHARSPGCTTPRCRSCRRSGRSGRAGGHSSGRRSPPSFRAPCGCRRARPRGARSGCRRGRAGDQGRTGSAVSPPGAGRRSKSRTSRAQDPRQRRRKWRERGTVV